jgi:hypothetical protein
MTAGTGNLFSAWAGRFMWRLSARGFKLNPHPALFSMSLGTPVLKRLNHPMDI